jgi:hypothetical protein
MSPLPALSLPPTTAGHESAHAVQSRLCRRPPLPRPTPASPGPVPQAIRRVQQEVQAVRGLRYLHPVAVNAVMHQQLVEGIDQSFDHSYPADLYARRGRAWQTIGVIPKDVDLRDALHRYLTTQVVGYYDPTTGQLVFVGSSKPSPLERLALAHELTHAVDDQHFNLRRLNGIENRCQDERVMAALGAIEGSAQFFMFRVGQRFFSIGNSLSILFQGNAPPAGVPAFLQDILLWPYLDGVRFIASLETRGGLAEVNGAIRNLPVSTEQVIHPDRYSGDVPTPVEVPDLGPKLGRDWRDLDVMDVGEAWLDAMLRPSTTPIVTIATRDPAAGWDGGQYRAWSDGSRVAVVLETVWDSPGEARSFASEAARWIGGRKDAVAGMSGAHATLLFASDPATLFLLKRMID